MVDSDQIEEEFKRKVDSLDKEYLSFLQGTSKKKPPKNLEQYYKDSMKKIITGYEKMFQIYLEEQRETFEPVRTGEDFLKRFEKEQMEKEKEEGMLDMSKPFAARIFDFSQSSKERRASLREIRSFRKAISRKKFLHRVVPDKGFHAYFLSRIWFRRVRLWMFDTWQDILSQTFVEIDEAKTTLLSFGSLVFALLKKSLLWVMALFKKMLGKRGTVKKEEEKSEDAKIAEKILAKKG